MTDEPDDPSALADVEAPVVGGASAAVECGAQNPVTWTNRVQATVDATTGALVKTGVIGWNSGGVSNNVLAANTDGSAELTITAQTKGNFQWGLSNYDVNVGPGSIDNAFYLYNGSMLLLTRWGTVGLGPIAVGDVYRMWRVDDEMFFAKNGRLINSHREHAAPALVVDASLYSAGAVLGDITTSFCAAELAARAAVADASCGAANGAIAVIEDPIVAPYTYAWTNGATTKSLSGLAAGDYTVAMVDAVGRRATETVTVGRAATEWARLNNVTFDRNTSVLTKRSATGWGNSGGFSADTIAAGADGAVQFSVNAVTGEKYMAGLSAVDDGDHYTTIDYAIYYSAGAILLYEDGVYRGGHGAATAGDVYRIAREGATIAYYRNSTLLRRVATSADQALGFDFSIYYNGDTIEDVVGVATGTCSEPIAVTATVSSATCGASDGGVGIAITGGVAPYTILWSTGATTETISGAAGTYGVTITDAAGTVFTGSYAITSKLAWASLTGVGSDPATGTLTKTGVIGWNAGGASSNVLAASAAGEVSFTVPAIAPGRWILGLSTVDDGLSYATVDFAFYYLSGQVYVYEDGAYRQVSVAAAPGDVFRIARSGGDIVYSRNGTVLRRAAAPASSLLVDFSMYDPGVVIHGATATFCAP